MSTGDIILIPFPFAELTQVKARPAVVIAQTADAYKDIIVAAISSVIPDTLSKNEFLIIPEAGNGLRVKSIVKVDRIVTTKKENIIVNLGSLSEGDAATFKNIFNGLVN